MNDVNIEPPLHPLSGEHFLYWLINIEDGTSLDVIASGFWSNVGERAFVYIRVFNPLAIPNADSLLLLAKGNMNRKKMIL